MREKIAIFDKIPFMKRWIYLFLLLSGLFAGACGSQQPAYTFVEEEGIGRIPVGRITRDVLMQEPYGQWFKARYDEYRPDAATVKALKGRNYKGYRVDIYMGTWCPDSREHVPHFLKTADAIGFPEKQIRIFALPRHYKEHSLVEGKNIIRVPTFIIYKDGKELGRIIEYPMETLEKDFLRIIDGKGYIHDYQQQS